MRPSTWRSAASRTSCRPWDEDGDLPLDTTRGVVWVTVGAQLPRILLHAPLVSDVVDEARALVEVNLLNRREFGLTFSLQDGHDHASRASST